MNAHFGQGRAAERQSVRQVAVLAVPREVAAAERVERHFVFCNENSKIDCDTFSADIEVAGAGAEVARSPRLG